MSKKLMNQMNRRFGFARNDWNKKLHDFGGLRHLKITGPLFHGFFGRRR